MFILESLKVSFTFQGFFLSIFSFTKHWWFLFRWNTEVNYGLRLSSIVEWFADLDDCCIVELNSKGKTNLMLKFFFFFIHCQFLHCDSFFVSCSTDEMARFFSTKEFGRLEKCQTNRQIHFDTCLQTVWAYRSTIWFYKLETRTNTHAHTVVATAAVVVIIAAAAAVTIASALCWLPQDTTNFPLLV